MPAPRADDVDPDRRCAPALAYAGAMMWSSLRQIAIPLRVAPLAGLLVFGGCGDEGDDASSDDAADSSNEGGGDGDGDGDGDGSCADPETHSGEGTYYDFADGSGNCGFPATPDDLMVGAMNHTDYDGSAACGTCVHVEGPDGAVNVRIVDRCPECAQGDIDLSPEAFEQIAPLSAGRVDISWTYVPCDVSGPVVYHFKDGSNQWWTAIQLRNHRHAIERLEYRGESDWVEVPRLDYNYFVAEEGMGPGPLELRVTDRWGHVLEDSGIPSLDDADASGAAQFPGCGD